MMQSAGGGLIAQTYKPEALSDDCERAALIVTLRQAPASCAASVIDADRLRRLGAVGARWICRRGGEAERHRPPVGAGSRRRERGRRQCSGTARRAPRAVDATPAEADLPADE